MPQLLIVALLLVFPKFIFSQDFDAEVIRYETSIVVKDNKLTKSISCKIKVNNRGGEAYTKVQIPYSSMDRVRGVKGSIQDINGQVLRELNRNEISDRSFISNISFYEDNYIKEFTLKHNNYPYLVEYSYELQQSEFIMIEKWDPVINYRIPTRYARLSVKTPNDYLILYNNQLISNPEISALDDEKIYTWEASYENIVKPEYFSPAIGNYLPEVTIVPLNFRYSNEGSFESWTSFGNWQFSLIKDLNNLPQIEKNRINDMVRNISDRREKIKQLYHYLQDETRYVNISIETGGLKPYPSSYVAENKFGDCKALTNYFKSVLEHIGIKSYYTKVHADDPVIPINKALPSQQFNHIILFIPMEKDTIWLDCTSKLAFNYLGQFTQNREVFVIDSNNSRFVSTPKLLPEQVLSTRKFIFNRDIYGSILANVRSTLRGDDYETLYYLLKQVSKTDQAQYIRKSYIEKGFELLEYDITSLDRDSAYITLTYNAKANSSYKSYGNDIFVAPISFSIPKLEDPKTRKNPVQIDYPVYIIDTLDYQIPDGYIVSNTLGVKTLSSPYGNYEIDLEVENGRLIVVKTFLLNDGSYPKEKYNEFYDFVSRVYSLDNNLKILMTKK